MSLLRHIEACNTYDHANLVPFVVGTDIVGGIARSLASTLACAGDALVLDRAGLRIADHLTTPEARTDALDALLRGVDEPHLRTLWNNERFAVCERFGGPVLMHIERAAVPLFGVRGYGVHLNGYCLAPGGRPEDIEMWIATRASRLGHAPGKLDNITAGGHAVGYTLADTLIKEAAEEASIPADLARESRAVSCISYQVAMHGGIRDDCLFCYDLLLPPDFEPVNADGEVAGFSRMTITEVAARVRETDDFKFNVPLVIIDFLIRHGLLTPENEPDYVALVTGLRQPRLPVVSRHREIRGR